MDASALTDDELNDALLAAMAQRDEARELVRTLGAEAASREEEATEDPAAQVVRPGAKQT